MKHVYYLGTAIALLSASAANAAETVTYQYDALGRLTKKSSAGTVNTNKRVTVCYDAAGNRKIYKVAADGATLVCPNPPPTPPPSNQPPVANADSMSLQCWSTSSKNVAANDTDPEGNYPLSLVSVAASGDVLASIASSTTINVEAQGTQGVTTVDYVIQDSLGATADGTLTVTVNGTINLCGS